MRITDDRYEEHRRSINLAWRLIQYEARTGTISRWTQLSDHRIRALYHSYAVTRHGRIAKRRRGMAPYKLEIIMASPQLRCEAAMFAGICRSVGILSEQEPPESTPVNDRLQRGELLCEAYDAFCHSLQDADLTFEQAELVLRELNLGDVVDLGRCHTCQGVVLIDRLSLAKPECVFCATGVDMPRVASPVSGSPVQPKLPLS